MERELGPLGRAVEKLVEIPRDYQVVLGPGLGEMVGVGQGEHQDHGKALHKGAVEEEQVDFVGQEEEAPGAVDSRGLLHCRRDSILGQDQRTQSKVHCIAAPALQARLSRERRK